MPSRWLTWRPTALLGIVAPWHGRFADPGWGLQIVSNKANPHTPFILLNALHIAGFLPPTIQLVIRIPHRQASGDRFRAPWRVRCREVIFCHVKGAAG